MEAGKFCKWSAIILFIINFVIFVTLGKVLGDYSFNWGIFLFGVITSFIFFLVLYTLGEIVDQLQASNYNTYRIYQLLDKKTFEEKDTEEKKSYLVSSLEKKGVDSGWVCKNCNTINEDSNKFCKDCGEYK